MLHCLSQVGFNKDETPQSIGQTEPSNCSSGARCSGSHHCYSCTHDKSKFNITYGFDLHWLFFLLRMLEYAVSEYPTILYKKNVTDDLVITSSVLIHFLTIPLTGYYCITFIFSQSYFIESSVHNDLY